MAVTALWLRDFRCFTEASVEPDPTGLTVLRGPNGAGKSSVLEAVGWLATQRSFRTALREPLVRTGCDRAYLRADVEISGRRVQLEAELPRSGPARTQLNRQVVRRRADLGEALRVTVFSPGDLDLVQAGPTHRRDYLDDVLIGRHPRFEALVADVERVLRQRAALLRQTGGRRGEDVDATLDVWDERLATAGSELVEARESLVRDLVPLVSAAYGHLAANHGDVTLTYRRSWEGDLHDALAGSRSDDLRRQATGIGPHRDDLDLAVAGRPARTHASQGEQRCLALALRLASHHLAAVDRPEPPVLLLDDVFSELDAARGRALVERLPPGQVLLTTASDPPDAVSADRVVAVDGGHLCAAGDRR